MVTQSCVVCWQLAEAGNVQNVKKLSFAACSASASFILDTFSMEIISLTAFASFKRWKKIRESHSSRPSKSSKSYESSAQAAVRQLHFNEWHLTEVWQRTLNR